MIINFIYHNTEELISSCTHTECLSINKGDEIIINSQLLQVERKVFINPHINNQLNIYCFVL